MKYISCPYRTCFTLKKFFFFFVKYNQLAIEMVISALSLVGVFVYSYAKTTLILL